MFKKKLLSLISMVLVLCMVLTLPAFAKNDHRFFGKDFKQYFGSGKHGRFMINKGIFKGDGKGDYFWKDYVKRGDIVVMIVRAFKLSAILGDNFPDIEANSYYFDAIRTAKSLGIAKGDGKKFNPKKYVTISEAIALIERSASVANSRIHVDTTVDLHKLYSKRELEYATRDEIAIMLYYILTGDTAEESYDLKAVEYTIDEDTRVLFDAKDFIDVLEDEADEDLDYVKFTLPASDYGTLYYGYKSPSDYGEKVRESDKYYGDDDDGKYLSRVTFVPHRNYSGMVSIEYKAFDEDKKSYTGIIEIDVLETDNDLKTMSYKTRKGTPVEFDADYFMDTLDDKTDEDLDYVKFTLPDSSLGKLYYDYESASEYEDVVKAAYEYYADADDDNDELDLSKVTFVPRSGYTGTVVIAYKAFDEDGDSYIGVVEIDVQETDNDLDVVRIDTKEDEAKTLDIDDFIDVLEDETDEDLDYVKFTLPAASFGKLTYNYKSASDNGSAVKAATKYYADPESNQLDLAKITFVPYANYTGTVTIDYTAFDGEGDSYSGKIIITVSELLKKISYTIEEDTSIEFDEDDFHEKLEDVAKKDLNYVKFTIPDTKEGKLYYDYKSSKVYGSVVKSTKKYYYDADNGADLSEVAFVPYLGYTGTVSIRYSAFDVSGISYNGIVEITVEED